MFLEFISYILRQLDIRYSSCYKKLKFKSNYFVSTEKTTAPMEKLLLLSS